MRVVLSAICLLSLPALAQTVIQGPIAPRNIVPTFDHGYLAVYEREGASIYKPDGSLAMRVTTPGHSPVTVDIDTDGSAMTADGYYRPQTGTISLFSPDGLPAGEIVTSPWFPTHVCFAPDHSIWALGIDEPHKKGEHHAYSLLRHYSRTRELLGEYLPRSSFPEDAQPGWPDVGLWTLRIVNGHLNAILHRTADNNQELWLELDLDGHEIARRPGRPWAITENGQAWSQGTGYSLFDRSTGTWQPFNGSSKDILLGAEGNTLVFQSRGTNMLRRALQP